MRRNKLQAHCPTRMCYCTPVDTIRPFIRSYDMLAVGLRGIRYNQITRQQHTPTIRYSFADYETYNRDGGISHD